MAARVPISSLVDAANDSERVLLGLLLLEPERFPEIGLAVDDFGDPRHRELFAGINSLEAEGVSWDSVSLIAYLKANGTLHKVGGAASLSDLTTGIPRHIAPNRHVRIVRDASLRRRAHMVFEAGATALSDASVDPGASLERTMKSARRLLDGLDDNGELLPYTPETGGYQREPELLRLSDVRASPVDWLWEPYLAAGTLAMLSGDPGGGKTYVALAIAAELSNGLMPFTSLPCEPLTTLYLSLENSPEHVVRPRFDLLHGNAERCHLLQGSVTKGKQQQRGSISLKDLDILEGSLQLTKAGLLIVDPIQSYLGADVDAHRSNETRPILDGLARLASQYQCCILLVRHLSKSSGGRAIHRGLGSIDLTGAVRTELMVGNAPNDPEQRALVHIAEPLPPKPKGMHRKTYNRLIAKALIIERQAVVSQFAVMSALLDEIPLQPCYLAGKKASADPYRIARENAMRLHNRLNGQDGPTKSGEKATSTGVLCRRLWEIAQLSPEQTNGSIMGQVRAIRAIARLRGWRK